MKACRKCGEEKPLDGFYAHPTNSDRRQTRCKACMKVASAERYRVMREAYLASLVAKS